QQVMVLRPRPLKHSLLRRGRINPAATHREVSLPILLTLVTCPIPRPMQVDRSLWAEGPLQAQHPHSPTHLSRQQVECMLLAGVPPRAFRLQDKPSQVSETAKEAPQGDEEGEPRSATRSRPHHKRWR
ncbi:hypothetical protein TcCL_Unassigned02545, partial [Trypanosoma cruzi]